MDHGVYLEHLTEADLALLARAGTGGRADAAELRSRPGLLGELLGDPAVFEAVFGRRGREEDPLVFVSPFCVFAVAVHRLAADLADAPYVEEWVDLRTTDARPPTGERRRLGRRVPVFDTAELREFLEEPARRAFLAELLASFSHVASGSTWVRGRRGWRRRRWSELDPLRFAELLDVVPEAQRAGVYRRLGDVSLFLTGVFPDHTATRGLGAAETSRLLRLGGEEAGPTGSSSGTLALFEDLGTRSYRAAYSLAGPVLTRSMEVVGQVADGFHSARRILNVLTERYLFTRRSRWFPSS